MAYTYVGSANGTTSVTMPTHAVGDVIIGFIFRSGSTVFPTVPTASGSVPTWTTYTQVGTSCCATVCVFQATATNTTSGTWTNATRMVFVVYRPDASYLYVMRPSFITGLLNQFSYNGLARLYPNNSNTYVAFAAHRSTDTTIDTPPTGFTLRNNNTTTAETAAFDLISPSVDFAQQSFPVGGTASGWITCIIEVGEYTEYFSQLSVNNDDCYDVSGVYTAGTTSLRMGSGNAIGVRFPGIPVSQGSAVVPGNTGVFFVGSGNPSGFSLGSIYAVASDNLAAWSSSNHPTTVTKTVNSILPTSSNFFAVPPALELGISPVAAINEVFSRSGWASGNAMGFVGDGLGSDTWTTIYANEGGQPTFTPALYLQFVDGAIINNGPVNGAAAITEGDDTVASVGKVALKGALAVTEANDTVVTAGTLPLKGALAVTEQNDMVSATQSATAINGTASITETNDGLVSTAAVAIKGSASITEGNDGVTGTGAVLVQGTASITEGNDTISAGSQRGIAADSSIVEANDTMVGTLAPDVPTTITGVSVRTIVGTVGLSYGWVEPAVGDSVTVVIGHSLPVSWIVTPLPTATWVPVLN